ncbi:MAG TPA: choice-of-anchor Q domain-containing protein [Solirubrobacterales bacterium]|nr:choice-of-anchor Q domain-containing protein [Solirubrobacterales bacterium]
MTVTNTSDSGAGSLRAVISAAGGGNTVAFDPSLNGQTIALTSGAIGIDKRLMIDGPGASQLMIDAGHSSQIFTVTAGDVSISGLGLANGAAPDNGGAIKQVGAGSLTVSGCTFTDNTAGGAGGSSDESNLGHGGAIYVSESSGPTSVSGSTFSANAAGGLGGIGFQSGLGSGGAIWDRGEALTVSGSTFTANTAGGNGDGGVQSGTGAGGAIQKAGGLSLTISDSEFIGNTAGGAGGSEESSGRGVGGAIYVSRPSGQPPSLAVTDSSFSDNAAGGAGGDGPISGTGEGGAIEHFSGGALTVSGTTFEGNSAGGAGGAGGVGNFFGPATGSGGGFGGAIFVAEFASSTSVSDSVFTANTAGGDGGSGGLSGRGEGGAIKGDSGTGPLTVARSTFTDSIAGGQDGVGNGSGAGVGGAINSFSSLTVTDSTFTGNAAGGQGGSGEGAFGFGGAISNFNNVSPLTISGSTFADNTAGGQGGAGDGGAIRVYSVSARSASISNSTLVGNAAGGGGAVGRGGAIEVDGKVSATLASVTIDANEIGAGGAGAGIVGTAAVTARATIVSGNTGATNCDVPAATSSYSLEGPSSGETSCGLDLPSTDPLLELLADNGGPAETQALPASSPAVDAVSVAKCPTKVDQRGEPRPDNGKSVCDVGAFELQDPPAVPTVTSAAAATFQAGKAGSFTITATGLPTPDLSLIGALPSGVSFIDKGDGTAILSGTPVAGTGGSYPTTIKAANGALPDAEQSFALMIQAPPTASIATPVDGATYTQGQAVGTSFTCAEGAGGLGIASCVDQDGRPAGTPLDTAAIGPHTFTVITTSKDGLTGKASVAYMVVAPATPKVPPPSRPRVLISYRQEGGIGGLRPSLVVTKDRQARVTLGGCAVKFVLGHRIWDRLRAALRSAHFHAIAGNYPPSKGSADEITYVIKARGEVVRIAPPQPEHEGMMRGLRPLLKALNKLASAGERRMPSSCKEQHQPRYR